ncbi:phospholipase effector Tle1 domain-containing protein [Pollutimonas harenae]|uniref:DUF2235 domain-containing protein n=1 Tax=Pollutimonas harenae TaxID=657015 RepID=A0A853H2X3_9BURK|nr:DUF2235 domain-containing protein [Pollutimonas harenae]NYT84504.1 DUF2235 domain-containing protein [Pollutimonas harenae]TEA73102.1 hypothetical protein ERD84_04105 [Pollutimonas harenae]
MPRPLYFMLYVYLLAGSMLVYAGAYAQGTCRPSVLGAPCSNGGVALAGQTEPGLNLGVGNPIHLVTGNKYQKEIDLPANPHLPGLELVRHYNALDQRNSVLGQGWALSYDTRLFHAGGKWQIVQADGSRISYAIASGKPAPNTYGTLAAQGTGWLWTWPTGRQLQFNAQGFLQSIATPDGMVLTLHRSQARGPLRHTLVRIDNGQGSELKFTYRIHENQAYLDQVKTPLGRFHYDYEAAGSHAEQTRAGLRLSSITRPDGMQRQYLYEAHLQSGNIYALTGINIAVAGQETRQRINTWSYDSNGRAILSISGPPDSLANKIHVAYLRTPRFDGQQGLTLVTQAGGQETRFHTSIKGERHVLDTVSGARCPGCAVPGLTAVYDGQGRLLNINGTHIQRTAHGQPTAIQPVAPGWPGLTMQYNNTGQRRSWYSSLTGTEHMLYNTRHLPLQRRFQNNDTSLYDYDAQGRPISITDSRAGASQQTRLSWRGTLLTRIQHPHVTENRRYDALKRLSQRQVERVSAIDGQRLRYTESFEYDAQHRLHQHHLPEGGALRYRWNKAGRLAAIYWLDTHGTMHTVIDSSVDTAGYRYGNGLNLHTYLNRQGQASQLTLGAANTAPIWMLDQHYDDRGLLQHEAYTVPELAYTETWRHAYNKQAQLIGAQGKRTQANIKNSPKKSQQDTLWYAWQANGALAARRHNGVTHIPSVQRDASGLPTAIDDHLLVYGPQRRLSQVLHKTGSMVARYLHDAFGHRIAKISANTRRDYFYLNEQLVAESHYAPEAGMLNRDHSRATASPHTTEAQPADRSATEQPLAISRRYIYAGPTLVGLIVYPDSLPGSQREPAQLYAIHTDLVGAPRLVTDSTQRIRWLAAYSPGGEATRIAGDLTLDLRLPGQVFDAETGWHDNLLRTYVPELGQYLEPDPLGPVPGSQALGYAAQQPRRHVDPLGLILFAFDGTRNSASTRSNVWKMSQAYLDGPVYYHSGPGNSMYIDWDAITANQAAQIIENQWQSLLNALNHSGSLVDYTPIDIIGYSRGAALARHFSNLINQYTQDNLFSYHDKQRGRVSACVDLRFMGLFDTVAQFGLAGSQNKLYDLSIPAAWGWVAHAVALHERRWAFPLTSAADTQGSNTIEAPFVGAHADIGGGVLRTPGNETAEPAGDLADVALNWMLWQARAATLRFDLSDPADRQITQPTLHDQRSILTRSVQDGDRSVNGADGTQTHYYQDSHPTLGRQQRDDTEALITRRPNWRSDAGAEVGIVDMSGYAQWLRDELGWQALPT